MKYSGIVYAVDPGTTESAFVKFVDEVPTEFKTLKNTDLLFEMNMWIDGVVVFEKISGYGNAVGETTFQTIHWTGRFHEKTRHYLNTQYLTRREIKLHLLGTNKGTDSMIRQEMVSRFGEKGTKKNPGLLYGIGKHEWQALAVGVAWIEIDKLRQMNEIPINDAIKVVYEGL